MRRYDLPVRGFSLVELLIAIALLLLLSGAMFGFVVDLLNTRERIEMFTARQRAANTLFQHLERDLAFAIVGSERDGAGVEGDSERISILTRRVAVQQAATGDATNALGDLQRVTYTFDSIRHTLRASRAEVPNENSATADSDSEFRIAESIYKIRIRFHDGSGWRDRFDSREADRLPIAVEVAVWFDPWPGEDWSERAGDEAFDRAFDDEPERLTFDVEGGFDEFDWAMRAARDFRPEPRPDRVRILSIPDAQEDDFDASPDDAEVF